MTTYNADTLVLRRASGETRWSVAALGDCFPDPQDLSAAADQLVLGLGEGTFGGGASPQVEIEAFHSVVRSEIVRAAAMLDAIHNLLDRTVWTASTLDDVAKIMRDGGYVIVEPAAHTRDIGPDERAEIHDTDPRDELAAEQEYCDRAAGRE
jgi:hypothetical protein